jgi:hypothetical protein
MGIFPYPDDFTEHNSVRDFNKNGFKMSALRDFFTGFKKGQKGFGESISSIINSVLLGIVYVLGVGLTSIFAKIFGKRFLEKKIDSQKKSYWQELNLGRKPKEEYLRQF